MTGNLKLPLLVVYKLFPLSSVYVYIYIYIRMYVCACRYKTKDSEVPAHGNESNGV